MGRIIQVLPAYIFADKIDLGIFYGDEGYRCATDRRRREGNIRFAVEFRLLSAIVVIIDVLGEIPDLVFTQAQVCTQVHPVGYTHPSLQFDTSPVTGWDIGSGISAHIVDLACKHQLIFIMHVIEVCAKRTGAGLFFHSQFQVL